MLMVAGVVELVKTLAAAEAVEVPVESLDDPLRRTASCASSRASTCCTCGGTRSSQVSDSLPRARERSSSKRVEQR